MRPSQSVILLRVQLVCCSAVHLYSYVLTSVTITTVNFSPPVRLTCCILVTGHYVQCVDCLLAVSFVLYEDSLLYIRLKPAFCTRFHNSQLRSPIHCIMQQQ